MVAYVVFVRDRVNDPAEMAAYAAETGGARIGHALTARAFYGTVRTLEGPAVDGAVILEFPTFAEAQAWYDSPLYQAARQHRLRGADYRAFIVEGVG